MKCNLCPKNCNIDRSQNVGGCKSGERVTLCRIAPHYWEEPCISGESGSGAVFFGGCNLNCRFCQNYDISKTGKGISVDSKTLEKVFLKLADSGVANINLVSPSHFSNVIADALQNVKHKLNVPVVYNTNSYEKVEAIRRLDGLVDVYLPDLKFCDGELAKNMCGAGNYFDVATETIKEMRRQQSKDVFENGLIKKGVIVRHLVLPAHVEDSKKVLDWLADTDKSLFVSVMAQYFPTHVDRDFAELNRKVTKREYSNVVDYFFAVGLVNGFCQDSESATEDYVPDFDLSGVEEYLNDLK